MTITVVQALLLAQHKLKDKREAEYLLSYSLDWSLTKLIAYPDYVLTPTEHQKFLKNLEERNLGIPLAYIKKSKSFWNIELEVNDSVLIPRPETELLIETIFSFNLDIPQVLDLGTGSGAIAIALAVNQPSWHVVATDFSESALAIAKRNARKYDLNNIEFYHGDWFQALLNNQIDIKFDVIVSNPPYVSPDSEYLKMGEVQFEPIQALVAPEHGLVDLKNIISHAKGFLKKDGYLLVEHGFDQAEAVKNMFVEAGFSEIIALKDFQQHDRVTCGKN